MRKILGLFIAVIFTVALSAWLAYAAPVPPPTKPYPDNADFKGDVTVRGRTVLDDVRITSATVTGQLTNAEVQANTSARHTRSHAITSTGDHTSAATPGQMLKADANGLPVDATNTDAAVAAAVSASHSPVTLDGTDGITDVFEMDGQTLQFASPGPGPWMVLGTDGDDVWYGGITLQDSHIPAGIARDIEVAAAIVAATYYDPTNGTLGITSLPTAAPSAADTTHVPTSKQVFDFVLPRSYDPTNGTVSHGLLSASHSDTTVGTVARGDLITGQGATPKWTRLAKGTANQVLSMDGTATDIVWADPPEGGEGGGYWTLAESDPGQEGEALPTDGQETGSANEWYNISNIFDGSDGTYAYCQDGGLFPKLSLFDYGFVVPTGATITGIKVEVRRRGFVDGGTGTVEDYLVRLCTDDGAVQIGQNKAAGLWGTSLETKTYGGEGDLWGANPTDTMVNLSGFGVTIQTLHESGSMNAIAEVYWVKMTVYYDEGLPGIETEYDVHVPGTLRAGNTIVADSVMTQFLMVENGGSIDSLEIPIISSVESLSTGEDGLSVDVPEARGITLTRNTIDYTNVLEPILDVQENNVSANHGGLPLLRVASTLDKEYFYGIEIAGGDGGIDDFFMVFRDYAGNFLDSLSYDGSGMVFAGESSRELKENIEPSKINGIDTLKSIPLLEYNKIGVDRTVNDFVLEDVEAVMPDAIITKNMPVYERVEIPKTQTVKRVIRNDDGTTRTVKVEVPVYGRDGKPVVISKLEPKRDELGAIMTRPVKLLIRERFTIPVLWKALTEEIAAREALQGRVTAAEARIATLEAQMADVLARVGALENTKTEIGETR